MTQSRIVTDLQQQLMTLEQGPTNTATASISDIRSDTWQRIRARLRFMLGEATFNSWFNHVQPASQDAHCYAVSVPTRFLSEWLHSNYRDQLLQAIQDELPTISRVDIIIANTQHAQAITASVNEQQASAVAQLAQSSAALPEQEENAAAFFGSSLDPRFTFAEFMEGSSNALAYAAAQAIASGGNTLPGTNPLYLKAGVGRGKTHLMQAIAHAIEEKQPSRRVLYLSAERFMLAFVRAIRNKTVIDFKDQFRDIDVFMVDDIQFICGKASTQEEFQHTFNALMDAGKQVVIASDRSPFELEGLDERMRSRLAGGLTVDIAAADSNLRSAIVASKARQAGMNLSDDVTYFLADNITANIRELEGALNRLIAHTSLMRQDITLELAQDILRDSIRMQRRDVSIADIQKTVSKHFDVSVNEICSKRRAQRYAKPRHFAMYLAKQLTAHSLPEIGRKFGGRDHTTVMHAVRRVDDLIVRDSAIANDIKTLTRVLQN